MTTIKFNNRKQRMFKKPTKKWKEIDCNECRISEQNPNTREGREWCYNNQAGRHFECRSCPLYLNMDTISVSEHNEYKKRYGRNDETVSK